MVHYHRYQLQRKVDGEETQSPVGFKKTKPTNLVRFIFLFSIISFIILLAPRLFAASTFHFFYTFVAQEEVQEETTLLSSGANNPITCSSLTDNDGSICCDRSSIRSDICFMKGDIRSVSSSSSIFLYSPTNTNTTQAGEEQHRIKPYTRKWETSVMNTIDELTLIKTMSNGSHEHHHCQVQHSVPAVFFSTGGYTGNVYHEFNDGIIPLYITTHHLKGDVVFVILEYHQWWITKYGEILALLSKYPPVDFMGDKRTHCFPEATVGLRIHDELTVNSSLLQNKASIRDFHKLLDDAYRPRIRSIESDKKEEQERGQVFKKPKLVIVSRKGSRVMVNEQSVVELAKEIGFRVEVMVPKPSTELAKIYRTINSCDVMVGIHGAAMTHLLFMKPGSVFIQVVPLGTDWAAQTYYGEPATKRGLKYLPYKILARESSLYAKHHRDRNDPVLSDPDSVNAKGWEVTKRVYLDGQNVTLDLKRFGKRLLRAYHYSIRRRNLAATKQE